MIGGGPDEDDVKFEVEVENLSVRWAFEVGMPSVLHMTSRKYSCKTWMVETYDSSVFKISLTIMCLLDLGATGGGAEAAESLMGGGLVGNVLGRAASPEREDGRGVMEEEEVELEKGESALTSTWASMRKSSGSRESE